MPSQVTCDSGWAYTELSKDDDDLREKGAGEAAATTASSCSGSAPAGSGMSSSKNSDAQSDSGFQDLLMHEAGQCKPCVWMRSSIGCMLGSRCGACHQPQHSTRRKKSSKVAAARPGVLCGQGSKQVDRMTVEDDCMPPLRLWRRLAES